MNLILLSWLSEIRSLVSDFRVCLCWGSINFCVCPLYRLFLEVGLMQPNAYVDHIILSHCQKVGCLPCPTPTVCLLSSVGSALPSVWMKYSSLQEPSHILRQSQPSESRNHRHKSLHLARRKHIGHWRNVSFECHWYKCSHYQSHSLKFLLYQMCHSGHSTYLRVLKLVSWTWRHRPVKLATWKPKVRGPQVQGLPEIQSEFKASLGI